jgi:hypothetical protein
VKCLVGECLTTDSEDEGVRVTFVLFENGPPIEGFVCGKHAHIVQDKAGTHYSIGPMKGPHRDHSG